MNEEWRTSQPELSTVKELYYEIRRSFRIGRRIYIHKEELSILYGTSSSDETKKLRWNGDESASLLSRLQNLDWGEK